MRDCGLVPFAKCRGYTIRDEKAKGRWCVERDIVVVFILFCIKLFIQNKLALLNFETAIYHKQAKLSAAQPPQLE